MLSQVPDTVTILCVQRGYYLDWVRVWGKSPFGSLGAWAVQRGPWGGRSRWDEGQSQTLCRTLQTGGGKWGSV